MHRVGGSVQHHVTLLVPAALVFAAILDDNMPAQGQSSSMDSRRQQQRLEQGQGVTRHDRRLIMDSVGAKETSLDLAGRLLPGAAATTLLEG